MKLNLGCGAHFVDGWVNVDYALGARLAKVPLFGRVNKRLRLTKVDWDPRIVIHDLTKRFPWPDLSVEAIYTSHTLEHFSKDDGRAFLNECHRVLAADGILRVVVPDLRHVVTEYLQGGVRADDFVSRLGVLPESSGGGLKRRVARLVQYPHRCMYNAASLVEIFGEVGFQATDRAPFESDIPDVGSLETEDRTKAAAIVEGRKRLA